MKTSLLIIGIILIISACQKYEEGPKISLRSPEKRLCQSWILEKTVYDDGTEVPSSSIYTIDDDGSMLIEADGDNTRTGWQLTNEVDFMMGGENYLVLRLTNNEMRLKHKEDLFVLHFAAKE
ncbi:MAG: hypothetical protein A2W91_11995 [Bacteroidetes bacterium GWF2_38_335]|nr:MAG: hypothetical protein A2W91_11995 [Bacteroidetes bacterium GWF2_38_335]OFY76895.1 MAG: hypothetical protein A2281_00110 [Bacteroidetes bacterium RIFOXYA12_FULL_38_20]HBS86743.1 hypothetical protein [Bacteroidales bacterium]